MKKKHTKKLCENLPKNKLSNYLKLTEYTMPY